MFLARDITKSWGIFLKGDPIQIISARHKEAIIVRCNGDTLTVSSEDITDVNPVPLRQIKPQSKIIPLNNSKIKNKKS